VFYLENKAKPSIIFVNLEILEKMIKIDFDNLFLQDTANGVQKDDFTIKSEIIGEYLNKIHDRKQGFYKTIDNKEIIDEINQYHEEIEGKYDDIVVLGIGGSALGTICLKQSLKYIHEDMLCSEKGPKLHVLDNIDPDLIGQIDGAIDYEKTLFIVISKSGGTVETLSQFFYFRKKFEDKNLDFTKNFVFVTDAKVGHLREIADTEGVKSFVVPDNVGGRFSVLTSVGLLPARLIGIDIEALIKGAQKMRDVFLTEDFEQNLPFKIAYAQYLLAKKNKNITVLMPYSQRLIRFADWHIQLLAESIGKAKNDNGEIVNIGLTPVKALGVTDQHSQNQLFNEGPNDKFFIFVEVLKHKNEIEIPGYGLEGLEYLEGVTFNKLMNTELKAAIYSLTQNNRPNIKISVSEINEEIMGGLFMLFEASIAFLGELFEINAFNQPGVELTKKLAKDFLKNE